MTLRRKSNASVGKQLMEQIYGEDVYASFEGRGLKEDLQGWGSTQFLLKVIEEMRPRPEGSPHFRVNHRVA